MFGFVYVICLIISGIKDSIYNETSKQISKQDAKRNGYDIYYDGDGNEYYNDRKVISLSYYRTPSGEYHKVIQDIKTKNVLKDYTEELIDVFMNQRKEVIEKAKQNNELYYHIDAPIQLVRDKDLYEKRIKGYCGFFETDTNKRYLLSSEWQKRNRKWVYKKYYYKKNDSNNEINRIYYTKDTPVIISKEEYFKWGGFDAENKNYNFIPKNGIV